MDDPETRVLHKYGLVAIKDRHLLVCKPFAFDDLILPGGVIEGDETPEEGLAREIAEELGSDAVLDLKSIQFLGTYEDAAAGRENTNVRIHGYLGNIGGSLQASSEIKQLVWFAPTDDRKLLSAIIRNKILPDLEARGLI